MSWHFFAMYSTSSKFNDAQILREKLVPKTKNKIPPKFTDYCETWSKTYK